MRNLDKYRLKEFPASRIATADIGGVGQGKHHIRALIELDVTEARKKIAEKKKQKENISFNSWLIKCISMAVEEFQDIHGVRKGKREIVIFDDIDISVIIERKVGGAKVPLPYVIRKTNEKSANEICGEIRQAQSQAIGDEGDYVLGERRNQRLMQLYYAMPGFLRRMIWKKIIGSPFLTKKNMGTVMVTSVGMMGRINGWVIPVSIHPLAFAVGSVIKKPGVVEGRIEIREYLYLTAAVDHDVVDGAPAVRALSRLADMVEKAAGL